MSQRQDQQPTSRQIAETGTDASVLDFQIDNSSTFPAPAYDSQRQRDDSTILFQKAMGSFLDNHAEGLATSPKPSDKQNSSSDFQESASSSNNNLGSSNQRE